MFILGIGGSPAGGKSTVAKRLEELGAIWINADLVARSVLELDDIQAQLIAHFGTEIAGEDGRVDRDKLAGCVFGDDDSKRAELRYLESLIHPRTGILINSQIRECAQQGTQAVLLDVPLLFKGALACMCDEIWCIDADRSIRLQRAADRGWKPDELGRREANQIDIDEKKRLSNFVVLNNGTLEQLHQQVDKLWALFVERQEGHHDPDKHCLGT